MFFLIKILSLASCKKIHDEHESYVNHFFRFREAIKLAHWPQDQELIRLVRDYQKNKPG